MSELHNSQAFYQHQARQIPTLYDPVNFCSKWVVNSFFLYFLGNSQMQSCGKHCLRAKGQGTKKQACFCLRFFLLKKQFAHSSTQCDLQYDCLDLILKS
jgi:hypothetical protein